MTIFYRVFSQWRFSEPYPNICGGYDRRSGTSPHPPIFCRPSSPDENFSMCKICTNCPRRQTNYILPNSRRQELGKNFAGFTIASYSCAVYPASRTPPVFLPEVGFRLGCGARIRDFPGVRKIVENTAFGNFARPQPSFQLVHFLHRLPTRYSP